MFVCCSSHRPDNDDDEDGVSSPVKTSFRLSQDKMTQDVVRKFNEGRTREALEDVGFGDPRNTAAWLHHTYGLDCTTLGDVMGDPQHAQLMKAYITKLAFRGQTLDQALRSLLKGFRLPGEAQKIDRIMDCFASHWCSQQGQTTLTPDTAYIVSFSLIMLNTDLHNPAVKRKMCLADFQRLLRGISNGEDLPDAWLADLYKSIKTKEICLKSKITERRKPAAIVSDLDQDCLEDLHLKARFRGAVCAVTTVVSMMETNSKKNPLFEANRLTIVSPEESCDGTALEDSIADSRLFETSI